MSLGERATMFEYRIAKYDPAIRSEGGKYTEWTSFSDVGATFDGKVLTPSAYEEVEAAYIAVATAFLREADAGSVSIRGLEHRKGRSGAVIRKRRASRRPTLFRRTHV